MTRRYAVRTSGTRSHRQVPQNYARMSPCWARGGQGLQAVMTVEGATDARSSEHMSSACGVRRCARGIVVMDNLRAHKAVGVQQASPAVGRVCCTCRLLARSVADRALWVKGQDRSAEGQGTRRDALDTAIHTCLTTVTAADAHSGLCIAAMLTIVCKTALRVRGVSPIGTNLWRARSPSASECFLYLPAVCERLDEKMLKGRHWPRYFPKAGIRCQIIEVKGT